MDSECYTVLLNQIAPPEAGVNMSPMDVRYHYPYAAHTICRGYDRTLGIANLFSRQGSRSFTLTRTLYSAAIYEVGLFSRLCQV